MINVTAENLAYGFFAWAKQQPKDEFYNYRSITNCALARYLKSVDAIPADGHVGGRTWVDRNGTTHYIPKDVAMALFHGSPNSTYGQLTRRLHRIVQPSRWNRFIDRLFGRFDQ